MAIRREFTPPEVHAARFGREAIKYVKLGAWIQASDMAQTAAMFARRAIEKQPSTTDKGE